MDIPILTKFINGLKLFFASKRLRWLTLVFLIGAIVISILGSIGFTLKATGNDTLLATIQPILILFSGIWPIFFLITTFLSILGLQRFVASDEDYKRSAVVFIPAIICSAIILVVFIIFALDIFQLIMWIAFLGWILFQAYFSMRTSLSYAEKASGVELTRAKKALITTSHIFCYIAIVVAFVYTTWFVSPGSGGFFEEVFRLLVLLFGMALAFLYNFLNGLILRRYSNKPTMMNIALVGLFVSLYASYFIYNAGKGPDLGIDFVGIGVTIFFLLYTMSSVGTSLASRAELDTRWKLSKELAATFTFFLASGYLFLDSLLPITAGDPVFGAALGDLIKLYLFPFVALIMELYYLRKIGKVLKPAPEPEEIPVIPTEEEPAAVEEPPIIELEEEVEFEEEEVEEELEVEEPEEEVEVEEPEESSDAEASEDWEETTEFESIEEPEDELEYEPSDSEISEDSSDEDYS